VYSVSVAHSHDSLLRAVKVSIEHEGCPVQSGYVRGSNEGSGWVVEPMGKSACNVVFVSHLDLKGNVEEDEVRSMSRELPLAISRLRNALSEEDRKKSKSGLRSPTRERRNM
jgi:hypothetical protein